MQTPPNSSQVTMPAWQRKAAHITAQARAQALATATRMGAAGTIAEHQIECGNLAAQIGVLCGQLAAFNNPRTTGLEYCLVELAGVKSKVEVGCSPFDDTVEVIEVWVNGVDLVEALSLKQIEDLADACVADLLEQGHEAVGEFRIQNMIAARELA